MRSVRQDAFRPLGHDEAGPLEPLVIHQHASGPSSQLVIFVHGLNGSRYGTWGLLPKFLFEDNDQIDVGLYDYASGLRRLGRHHSIDLDAHARQLADSIRDLSYERVVLIGHSLGGLLCKSVIKDLFDSQTKTRTGVLALRRVAGLFLLATPQAGSLRVPRMLWSATQDARTLHAHSRLVTEINKRFADRVDPYGTAPPERGLIHLPIYAVIANGDAWVDELSAGLNLSRDRLKVVRGSHSSIVKPQAKDDELYQWLMDSIRVCLAHEQDGAVRTSPQIEDPSTARRRRVAHQLPDAADDFSLFGRTAELDQARDRLLARAGRRLVHIRGEAGVGKTTAAIRLARSVSSVYSAGEIYLDLRGEDGTIISVKEALTWCITSMNYDQQLPARVEELTALYRTLLSETNAVIVLDNAADESQVLQLLPNEESQSAVILTSRRSLASLHLAPNRTIDLTPLNDDDAIKMLAEQSGRDIGGSDSGVRNIIEKCAGLPFALALVAAHLRTLPHLRPSDVALSVASPPLVHSSASTGSLLLAYQELAEPGRRLFLALTDLGLGSLPVWIVRGVINELKVGSDALDELVDAKLLRPSDSGRVTGPRFLIHDLVVEFGQAHSAGSVPRTQIRGAAAAAHLRVLASAQHVIESHRFSYATDAGLRYEKSMFKDEEAAISALESLRLTTAAVFRLVDTEEGEDKYIELATTLPFCLILQGTWFDWVEFVERALAASRRKGNWLAEAYLHHALNNLLRSSGFAKEGFKEAAASVETFAGHGHSVGRAYALIDVAIGSLTEGNHESGVGILRDILTVFEASSNEYWTAIVQKELGAALVESNRADEGGAYLDRARQALASMHDTRWETYTLLNLGDAYRAQAIRLSAAERARLLTRARNCYERILAWSGRHSEWRVEAWANMGLAATACAEGRFEESHEVLSLALARLSQLGDHRTKTFGELLAAYVVREEGHNQAAIARLDRLIPALREVGDMRRLAQALLIRGLAKLSLGMTEQEAFDIMPIEEISARVPALAEDRPSLDELRAYVPVVASWF